MFRCLHELRRLDEIVDDYFDAILMTHDIPMAKILARTVGPADPRVDRVLFVLRGLNARHLEEFARAAVPTSLHEVIRLSGMNLIIDDTDHPLIIKVASIQAARMQIYFIDNEDFFQRKYLLHDDDGVEFPDNDERSIFYVRGVMETVKKLRWAPDLIHCHGWMTALTPLYIKKHYGSDPCFRNAKVVYSVYDDDFQQPLRENFARKAVIEGVTDEDLKPIETVADFESLTRLAIDFSDGVIQNSPQIHPGVEKYLTTEAKIPFLEYHPEETYIDAFNEFYDQILSK
ncbi:MAG: glycogen/starch synthase [Dysgonamonadaceae bacterium]|jgi:starch synthase|nr:glycogen/starch synthase [Dysgonamonadaceae bacterium]